MPCVISEKGSGKASYRCLFPDPYLLKVLDFKTVSIIVYGFAIRRRVPRKTTRRRGRLLHALETVDRQVYASELRFQRSATVHLPNARRLVVHRKYDQSGIRQVRSQRDYMMEW